MKTYTITKYLNELLDIKNIPDGSRNGTQVKVSNEVTKIGFAVDASLTTFEKAKKQKCDLVVVHHGLLWKPKKRETVLEKRIQYLRKNSISLYAAHLPLDLHAEFGNNSGLANILGLERIRTFGDWGGMDIGYAGYFKKPVSIQWIAKTLEKEIKATNKILPFGKKKIKSIAILSGKGVDVFDESLKYDCFLTGEGKHSIYPEAEDAGQNMIIAGHYATEIVGVKLLKEHVQNKFKIKTVFLDSPTGM